MSDVGAIVSQALDQTQVQTGTQVQVSVLKKALEIEKETMKELLGSFGIGQKLDVTA